MAFASPNLRLDPAPARIVVFRGGALGDTLITLPALSALRTAYPQATVCLVGNPTAATLIREAGWIDEVRSQSDARWSPLFSPGPLPADLQQWLAAADLVVNYWPDPDGRVASHFPSRPGQRFVHHPTTTISTCPASEHFLQPLRSLGVVSEPRATRPLLSLPAASPANTLPAGADWIVHPGSGSRSKNWPVDRWREVMEHSPARSFVVVLGRTDLDMGLTATCFAGLANVRVVVDRSLTEIAAVLRSARGFLGHDTGMAHLAAALGTRCLLLFGPTCPEIWAPPYPWVNYIREGETMEAIPVRTVIARLRDERAIDRRSTQS